MKANELLQHLCDVYGLSQEEGYADTALDEVKLFRMSKTEQHVIPLLYRPGMIFIGQGRKAGHTCGQHFEFGTDQYLIVTSVQPIECQNFIIKGQMLGIYIEFNMARLHRMVSRLQQMELQVFDKPCATPVCVTSSMKCEVVEEAYLRLLKVLTHKIDARMIGDGILDELYFRVLRGEHGYILRQLCEHSNAFAKVSKILEHLYRCLDEKISVEDMARMTDMSVNSFHKAFKEAFNDTPVQYIKKIRLNKARQYIVHENMKANEAAARVGYDSPTQFSREFKRYFGVPPSQAKNLGYVAF